MESKRIAEWPGVLGDIPEAAPAEALQDVLLSLVTVLYYNTILYYTVLYSAILYYILPHCIILYFTTRYLYCTILYWVDRLVVTFIFA